jgi:hypothetical protein
MEKKFQEKAAALIMPEEVKGRNVRLMFQDEARFGRMVRIRRCWAPEPSRPSAFGTMIFPNSFFKSSI